MPDYTFFHNTYTCLGCSACQVACKDKKNLEAGQFFRRAFPIVSKKSGKQRFLSLACSHCEDPACVTACPNNALYISEEKFVLHDAGLCIGCGCCVWSCPFAAISLDAKTGLAQKCDGCQDLLAEGLSPACVAACPNGSLQFGQTDGRCPENEIDSTLEGTLPGETRPRIRLYDQGRKEE